MIKNREIESREKLISECLKLREEIYRGIKIEDNNLVILARNYNDLTEHRDIQPVLI